MRHKKRLTHNQPANGLHLKKFLSFNLHGKETVREQNNMLDFVSSQKEKRSTVLLHVSLLHPPLHKIMRLKIFFPISKKGFR